jgi:rubrerythrin
MKHPSSGSARSLVVHLVLACFALSIAWLVAGCQKGEVPKEEPKTLVSIENLQTAYGRETKQSRMYGLFSPRAGKEKYKGVTALYSALERSESIHAAMHASMMREHGIEPGPVKYDSIVVGTTMQTVKMALSFEELEFGSMYPNLARTALYDDPRRRGTPRGAPQGYAGQGGEDRREIPPLPGVRVCHHVRPDGRVPGLQGPKGEIRKSLITHRT